MKDRICLDFKYIFSDHLGKCSDQAKLYYIKLMFFASNGFVANPLEILKSLNYDIKVFYELKNADEILTLPGRDEVFITAYFVHTHFNPASWLSTPYATYWRGHLRTKSNGVATFKKIEPETNEEKDDSENTKFSEDWAKLLDEPDNNK